MAGTVKPGAPAFAMLGALNVAPELSATSPAFQPLSRRFRMNANLQRTSQPSSPLLSAAVQVNMKSGDNMKHHWIEQVLKDMHRTNETMSRRKKQ
jgi:hypothetical protein